MCIRDRFERHMHFVEKSPSAKETEKRKDDELENKVRYELEMRDREVRAEQQMKKKKQADVRSDLVKTLNNQVLDRKKREEDEARAMKEQAEYWKNDTMKFYEDQRQKKEAVKSLQKEYTEQLGKQVDDKVTWSQVASPKKVNPTEASMNKDTILHITKLRQSHQIQANHEGTPTVGLYKREMRY
eukprot:TRINITY_DN11288_c0_g1_i1.p1 TRINITY_DN11288_c0_g1~~TRINITY_DN11288_c0_g1_i1.p1  ORF type:complete len:205 (-),score=51.77 TRINITY_DN11288_c0_g1_i1:358-912(-)